MTATSKWCPWKRAVPLQIFDHEILGPTWRRTARPTAVNRCTIAVINSAEGTEAPSPRAPRHRSLKPLSRPRTHWQPSARLKVELHCSIYRVAQSMKGTPRSVFEIVKLLSYTVLIMKFFLRDMCTTGVLPMSCTLSVVDGVPLVESRLGKLLKSMKTVALSLLLRCPNYSTGPLAPCWSLAPIQYKNSMTGAHL